MFILVSIFSTRKWGGLWGITLYRALSCNIEIYNGIVRFPCDSTAVLFG